MGYEQRLSASSGPQGMEQDSPEAIARDLRAHSMEELTERAKKEKAASAHGESSPAFEYWCNLRKLKFIQVKGLFPADEVTIPGENMRGRIRGIELFKNVPKPIMVERADGETRAYEPKELFADFPEID